MSQIIDGKKLAQEIREQVKQEIQKLGITPGLAVILVGSDPASHLYVNLKQKACNETGIKSEKFLYFATVAEEEVINKIKELNERKDIHGILVQLPLPSHLNENKIIQTIDPKKDVDGFHPENSKKLLADKPTIISGLILGIVNLIESCEIDLTNKKALIIANSETFAEPLVKVLENKKIKADYCLKNDKKLTEKSLAADILIVAVGQPKFITTDMVKQNSIIIDVGFNRVDDKPIGDVDFENVKDKAAFITPVPGGVGPMTVAMLLKNTLELAKK